MLCPELGPAEMALQIEIGRGTPIREMSAVGRRRDDRIRARFETQLTEMPMWPQTGGTTCHTALRFPGCLLRPGEIVPREVLVFGAGQLDVDPDALAAYAIRSPNQSLRTAAP